MAVRNGNRRGSGDPSHTANKPLVVYPCTWSYTVIGEDAAQLARAIPEALADSLPEWRHSHTSRRGRYASFHVAVHVRSEEHRDAVFNALRAIPSVRFVL